MPPTKKAKKNPTAARASRRVTGSMADQIDQMDVGQSVAIAERFEFAEAESTALLARLQHMRATMGSYVSRATDDLDSREFKIAGGSYVPNDKSAVILVTTVTRTA